MTNKRFLPYSRQFISKDDIKRVLTVLKSDFITQGPEIINFEKNFAKYVGSKYAVACATGTAALHISCLALGINNKSKVLTSAITFVASANCAEFIGANVDFVDIDKQTHCISIEDLERKLKQNKKVDLVIVVHLAGYSSDMKKILKLKKKYKFNLIEDSCHALGGKYNDSKVGSCNYSDISTFSFHPVKPITTGEGGMITTNNQKIYEKLILYRTHGIHKNSKKFTNLSLGFDKNKEPNRWYYEMTDLGYNYRLTDIQAALGSSQLERIDKITKRRNQVANFYKKELKNISSLTLPVASKKIYHAYHLFTILLNFKKLNMSKNFFMKKLAENGIGSQVLYIPVFLQPYYKKKYNFNLKNFPNAMHYYESALSIPIFYDITKKELKKVVNTIKKLTKNI